jgi:hypothetical protein
LAAIVGPRSSRLVFMSTLSPLAVLSAVASLGSASHDWTLREGEGTRSFSHVVAFEHAFSAAPVVHLGIVGADTSKEHNLRLRARAENVTSSGFTLVVETWLHSQVFGVEVSWLAIGQ